MQIVNSYVFRKHMQYRAHPKWEGAALWVQNPWVQSTVWFHAEKSAKDVEARQRLPKILHSVKRRKRLDLEQQLTMEDECQTIAGESADFKEGVQAFLEKRKPTFKGE